MIEPFFCPPHKKSIKTPQFRPRIFMQKILPDFCWQTYMEIVTFLEQEYEDVNPRSVAAILCLMAKNGQIITRPMKLRPGAVRERTGTLGFEYLRASQ